jgi:hypothetical protein
MISHGLGTIPPKPIPFRHRYIQLREASVGLAAAAGASGQLVCLPVDRATKRARITHCQAHAPHRTFPIGQAAADTWRAQFQAPDAAELAGTHLPGPPPGWPGWPDRAADRWPSLADG